MLLCTTYITCKKDWDELGKLNKLGILWLVVYRGNK